MRIGLMCSGGDAPGMNACIRGVVRSAVAAGHEVIGFMRGYTGILDEMIYQSSEGSLTMGLRSVSGLSMLGGTVLHSSRCPRFRELEGRQLAAANLRKHEIDALVVIGGNGSLSGAIELMELWDGQVIGCPGTIDNDLNGTDYTIGFWTAVQTAVEAVDKLRDTANSHDRMFLVEVMGRHSGYIALYTALAAGAEIACIPEIPFDIGQQVELVQKMKQRGKTSVMMVVAEGVLGGAVQLQVAMQEAGCPFPMRTVMLGHLQRGGHPVPADRILGGQLGAAAVQAILDGENGKMVGVDDDRPVLVTFEEAVRKHHQVPDDMVRLLQVLSR